MRIVHAAETIKGGVASIIRVLAANESGDAPNMDVICVVPEEHRRDLGGISGPVYTFRRTGRNGISLVNFALRLLLVVWKERPDIVHLHSTFAGLVGRIVLALLRPFRSPRIVYCPHGWAFSSESSGASRRLFALVERALATFCSAIVCVSEDERCVALRFKLPAHKLRLIPNGVPPCDTQAALEATPYPAAKDVLNVLFVGRFDRQKGIDVLLSAMSRLQGLPIHLTAVGSAVRDSFEPPKMSNVTYTGWLAPERVRTYLAHSDVVVVPSRWEAFGLAAAEALSYGRPVIASNVGGLREVVAPGVTGVLVETEDASALAAILRDTPRSQWIEMGKAAHEQYAHSFTADACRVETIKLYAHLVEAAVVTESARLQGLKVQARG